MGSTLSTQRVFRTWWPLTASWLLMSLEGPAMNIVVARLAQPKVHLAAFGSLVMPLAQVINSPVVMLLAASTALSADHRAYEKMRRFMHIACAILTALHIVIACTPLYDIIVRTVLGAPEEIVEPGRIGLLLAIPWTWALAYRRFNQGVLIRFGHSSAIGVGTLIRLCANAAVLAAGYILGSVPGTAVATAAITVGIIVEAIYSGLRVQPVLHNELPRESAGQPLEYRTFLRFYVPLSLTSVILLGVRPLFTAAISRMPNPLDSLAVFPVVTGLIYLFRSPGVAYNETSIAHIAEVGSTRTLPRFARSLVIGSSVAAAVVAATPLCHIWFGTITGLDESLLSLAVAGFWLASLLPAISVLQSHYQGAILYSRKTRSITVAVAVYLVATTTLLWSAIAWRTIPGIYAAIVAMTVGEILRTVWMGRSSRRVWTELRKRDAAEA